MTEYITGVLVASWLLCFASLAVYGGKCDGATKAAFAVLLFYTVVIPLAPLVEEFEPERLFSDIRLEDFELDGEYSAVAEEAFCDGVKELLCEKYAIEKGEVRVSLDSFDFEKMTAEKIKITLTGKAVLKDYKAMEQYIESLGGWECEVEIEIG